jgi:K+:H+ antiporter subunit KhtU
VAADGLSLAAVGGGDAPLLLEIGALVLALGVLARIADRVEISPIPLYLIAGLVLGVISDEPLSFSGEVIEIGAQIGLVLLLFMLGLAYTGDELAASLRGSLPDGVLDVALNFTPGLLAGLALGWDFTSALLLGGVTYISSSGVIAKVLDDLDRLGNRETPAVLSILVLEDLAMALYLPVIAVVLADTALAGGLALAAVALLAAAAALWIALRHGHTASRLLASRSDEVLLLTVLGFVLLVAGGAEGLKLSAAVGAFLAGILVSGSVAERVRELFTPLRDLFAAAFFIFFGLQVDAGAIPPVLLVAVALAMLTGATKAVTGWQAAKRIGVGIPGRVRAGTALVARGEFSIVIAGLGVTAGLEDDLGPLAAAYVLLTALAGPVVTRFADRIAVTVRARLAGAAA